MVDNAVAIAVATAGALVRVWGLLDAGGASDSATRCTGLQDSPACNRVRLLTSSTIHMLAHSAWAQALMFAGAAELGLVRGKLHHPAWRLATPLAILVSGLAFLVHEGGAESVIDAAYRFVRHEPGIDVVLFGTSSVEHLKANVASILGPPLPVEDVARLYTLFGHLTGVGLDLPDRVRT